MKIEITEQQINNIMLFLDRVEIKGHKERHAMNELEYIFTKMFKEQENGGKEV